MAGGLSKCPEYKCNRGVMDTAYVRLHCVWGIFRLLQSGMQSWKIIIKIKQFQDASL